MSDESKGRANNVGKPSSGKQAAGKREGQRSKLKKDKPTGAKGERKEAKSDSNPIHADPTYRELQQDSRVVMRHQIALNLDSFRASTDDFVARPEGVYTPLQSAPPPFFSVVLPNFNGIAHLPGVLAALDAQTLRDFEIIVIDDASRDQSTAWIEEHYPQVRLIVNRENVGFAVSCNLGAEAAYGRFIVLLNSDTEPEPDWLAELAQAICRHPEAGIFASKLLLFDRRNVIHSAGDAMGIDGVPRNRGVWEQDDGRYAVEEPVFGACGGAAAIRRDVWQALGGFDESMWMYLEDADLAFRSRLMGIQTVFVPAARVYHHLSATGGGELASYFVGRNTLWLIAKNMPAGLLLRNFVAIVAAQVRTAIEAAQAYQGAEAQARLQGMAAGLLGLPSVLVKRRAIQPRRLVTDEELARQFQQ